MLPLFSLSQGLNNHKNVSNLNIFTKKRTTRLEINAKNTKNFNNLKKVNINKEDINVLKYIENKENIIMDNNMNKDKHTYSNFNKRKRKTKSFYSKKNINLIL